MIRGKVTAPNKYPIGTSGTSNPLGSGSFHNSGSNRPPSSTNRKNNESPGKGFQFNVQGVNAMYAGPGTRGGMNVEKLQTQNLTSKGILDEYPSVAGIELNDQEDDERYRYLLKHGIVRKVEDEDKIIFAELPQIPGVLVVYRKPSERSSNPERLNLDKRELNHLPLLEGEERLRLLNLQHNYITKIENLVSLPNLIFLDLYNNEIKEITNLHTVPTLRVLMLGRNHIERARNLRSLTKLDVLDLHSNKISKIENLNHLSELRVLNLANNLIAIVDSLNGLVSLTELNLRRNLIESVHGLGACPKLQRIFLSNNRIEKSENIVCLKDAGQLTELALDGNPLANEGKSYLKMCLDLCPQLKSLDLKKVSLEMREQIKKTECTTEGELETNAGGVVVGGINTTGTINREMGPTPVKGGTASPGGTPSTAPTSDQPDTKKESRTDEGNLGIGRLEEGKSPEGGKTTVDDKEDVEDISPESLLEVIAQEWKNELQRLKNKYFSGRRKKDAHSDCLVQSGHAEIEGDSMLFIYGNALEVLNNTDFQKTVEQICFQYVRFDNIVHHSNLQKLKRFSKLKKLICSDNFLYSFIQISKLECLSLLTSITIENNDVANTALYRTFIVYRFPSITDIDGIPVSELDKLRAKKQFQNFDKILSSQSFFTLKKRAAEKEDLKDDSKNLSSKQQRLLKHKNVEVTQNFLYNVLKQSVQNEMKCEQLDKDWDSVLESEIYQAAYEINEEQITEPAMRKLVNL